jgi:hypothetical protein
MGQITLQVVDAIDLRRWAAELAALEAAITYPIDDGRDRFAIDHGAAYHPFFSAMGDPRFLLAFDDGRVVGSVAGVFRDAYERGVHTPSVYLCDFKIAASHRGTGLGRRMAGHALWRAVTDRSLWRWQVAYAAAMRGERGDVMRSARGLHAAHLMRAGATLAVYFVPAKTLAALDSRDCPPPPTASGLDLSPAVTQTSRGPGVTTTAGRKDLRLVSTGDPWPLHHLTLGPRDWAPSWGQWLRACGEYVSASDGGEAVTCFTLDQRLDDHTKWLAAQGVTAGATCTVYVLRLPWLAAPTPAWVHLSPSEI